MLIYVYFQHSSVDFSCPYVILKTDSDIEGHGITFTVGRGSETGKFSHVTISVKHLLIREFFLFDLILFVHSTIFQLCGTVLPGFNQY